MHAERRIVELAGAWWRKALDDLEVARRVADLPFACCFHCQQAVEKAIKALLVLHQIDFRKLHDIGQLVRLLQASPSVPPAARIEGLESLTRYAVVARYPPGDASPQEARRALEMATSFLDWARATLPPETHPAEPNTKGT